MQSAPRDQQLAKWTIVERIVRPVRTPIGQKRKIREELLAHLEGALAEELKTTSDGVAALNAAAKRLGDPKILSAELDQQVSILDRLSYHVERLLGYRAPESAARYLLRVAMALGAIETIVLLPFLILNSRSVGLSALQLPGFQFLIAFMASLPLGQFCVGLIYFKIRDTWWGAFGSRRSITRLVTLSLTMALMVGSGSYLFMTLAPWHAATRLQMGVSSTAVAISMTAMYVLMARFRGQLEIADTIWACLSVDGNQPQIAS